MASELFCCLQLPCLPASFLTAGIFSQGFCYHRLRPCWQRGEGDVSQGNARRRTGRMDRMQDGKSGKASAEATRSGDSQVAAATAQSRDAHATAAETQVRSAHAAVAETQARDAQAAAGRAEGTPHAADRPNKWVVLFTVVVMTFMSTLDSSIVNVAVPSIQRALGATASEIQWVSSMYLLVCCVTVLVFGRLGDRYGKVRLFQAGVVLFSIGSLLCGLSTTLVMLIGARVVQGLGASCAMANNMGIVTEVFPARERGRALGIVSTFVSLGLMCGPVVGGIMVASLPWESIFLINVPIGVVSCLVGLKTLPREPREAAVQQGAFDVRGVLLMAPAIFAMFIAITWAGSGDYLVAAAMALAGLVLLGIFTVAERRAETPLVRLDLLRNPVFSINLIAMLCCFFAVGSTEFILPFYLQDACGFPSDVAGLVITAIPLAMAIASPIAGSISDRIGTTVPCLVGLAIYAAGVALAGGLSTTAAIPVIYGTLVFMAVGDGLFESPNNSRIMGSVDQKDLGFAGSLGTLVRYMGMSAGVTGGTALLYGQMGALAGHPVAGYVEGEPELFMAGFSFAFAVIAAVVAAGAVLTVVSALLKRRSRAHHA